jgi:hypothetical protein
VGGGRGNMTASAETASLASLYYTGKEEMVYNHQLLFEYLMKSVYSRFWAGYVNKQIIDCNANASNYWFILYIDCVNNFICLYCWLLLLISGLLKLGVLDP